MKTMIEIKRPAESVFLAIGCGDGREIEDVVAAEIHGVDFSPSLIGKAKFRLTRGLASGMRKGKWYGLQVASAEALPYEDNYFTDIMARVSLPYTDIPKALAEIARVAKPGANIFLTMHDWEMQWEWMKIAAKGGHWKRVIDCGYVFAASWFYALTGICLKKPWNGHRETFQTQHRLRKQLRAAGLTVTHMARTKHIEIEATKPMMWPHGLKYAKQVW